MKKRILSMLLVIVMVLSVLPVQALADGGSLKITSNQEMQYTLEKDKELTLTLAGANEDDDIVWTSGNTEIAEVQQNADDKTKCVVRGVGEGKLSITATVTPSGGDAQTATYPLGVFEMVTEKPVIDGGDFSMTLGGTVKTMTYQKPDGVFGVELTRWQSSNPNVATIGLTSGELTAKTAGTTQISVFFNGQWSDPVTCTVVEKLTAEIVGSSPMVVGREQELTLVFNTDHDLPETIDWRRSPENSDLVTLTEVSGNEYKCKVKAEKDGEVFVVAAWGTPEEKAELSLTINKPEQFTVMRGETVVEPEVGLTLKGKETAELTAAVYNGEDLSKVKWNVVTDGNGAIVTQCDGNKITVTGAHPGEATISAFIQGDRENTEVIIPVTVEPKVTVENLPKGEEKVTLYAGDTFICDLNAELVDADGIILVPDKEGIVQVDGHTITANQADECVTISLVKDGKVLTFFEMEVKSQARVEIDPEMPLKLLGGNKMDLKAVVKGADGTVLEDKTVSWRYVKATDANLTILNNGTLTAQNGFTVPFTVELEAYVDDAELNALPAHVSIDMIPRTHGITLKNNGEDITGKSCGMNVADPAGITITAEVNPVGAEESVTWAIEGSESIYRKEVESTGALRLFPVAGQKTGTLVVTATAGDGTGVTAQTTVVLNKLATELRILDLKDAPETNYLRGGEILRLRTNLDEDKTLTNREIEWKVSDEKLAQISADGVLDTAAVTERKPITVTATLKANGLTASKDIVLCPSVEKIQIMRKVGSDLVQMKTQVGFNEKIILDKVVTAKDGYIDAFMWDSSNKNVAAFDPETPGSLILKNAGKTQITCTAKDGSNTIGYLNLEVVKKAANVVIDDECEDTLVSGKSAVMTAKVYADNELKVLAGNQNVTWSVVGEDYQPTKAASINSRGRLVAKTVDYGVNVIVVARSEEDKDVYDEFPVTIKPKKVKNFLAVMTDDPEDLILDSSVSLNIDDETSIFGQWYISADNSFEDEFDCTYFTSNSSVASIDENGTLKAKKAGSATITVRATDPDSGNVYTTKFTVKVSNLVGYVEINESGKPADDVLNGGKSVTLTATAWVNSGKVRKADSQSFTWKVYQKNEDGDYVTAKAASVSSGGKVTANSVKVNTTVYVVATSKANSTFYDYYELTIRPKYSYTLRVFCEDMVDGEKVERTGTWNVEIGEKDTEVPNVKALAYSREFGHDVGVDVTWSTSNSKIVGVNNKNVGNKLIFGGKTGKVKVTAKFVDGKTTYTASMYLNVVKSVNSVIVSKKYATQELYSGKTLLMVAKVESDTNVAPTNKSVVWTCDASKDVATINSTTGLIRANKGLTKKVTINVTATAADGSGKTDYMEVTIYPLATKVTIKKGADAVTVMDMANGTSENLTAEFTPVGEANSAAVKWSTSRSSVVSVDKDGKITAKRKGTATIKASATDGSGKYATVKVTVK